jgi:hypothetical protein
MIAALLALAVPDLGPVLPAGASGDVLGTAVRVQRALEAGEFELARRLVDRLPKRQAAIVWDDTAVPAERRAAFRQALDAAVAEWAGALPEFSLRVAARGEVKATFTRSLPPPPDGYRPAGAVHFYSEDPREPVLEAVIALEREDPPQPSEQTDVRNDVCRLVGAYLGLAESPRALSVMSRADFLTSVPTRVGQRERALALGVLEAADALRKAVAERVRLVPAVPAIAVRQTEFEAPPTLQGGKLEFEVEVSNTGTAPLSIVPVPDCGCFTVRNNPVLEPGQSSLVKVYVDTFDVPGEFDKKVHLRTNDPERPDVVCRFRSRVRPVYRVVRREGTQPVYAEGGSAEAEVFVLHQPERPFRILSAALTGVKGSVETQPWSGRLADPAYNEPEAERCGHLLRLRFRDVPAGRTQASLQLKTDDPDHPNIFANVAVQSGIAAVPARLHMGNVLRSGRRASVLVSRPGRKFRVTGVRSSSPHMSAEARPYRDQGDFRVVVELLPTAPAGNFEAEVAVATDDPAQPTVRVPVSATVP